MGHPQTCGVEIVATDPTNGSRSMTLRPACGPLISATVNGKPDGAGPDKTAALVFALTAVVVVGLGIAILVRLHRRRVKKRRRNDDAFSLPRTVVEISKCWALHLESVLVLLRSRRFQVRTTSTSYDESITAIQSYVQLRNMLTKTCLIWSRRNYSSDRPRWSSKG